MDKSLSNFQINKFFMDEENEEIKKNYMGVYSVDLITRYIKFLKIIKRKNCKYPFAILKTDMTNLEHIGGVLWIFTPHKTYFYFTDLVLKHSIFLLLITTTKLLTNYFMISKNVNLNQIKIKTLCYEVLC